MAQSNFFSLIGVVFKRYGMARNAARFRCSSLEATTKNIYLEKSLFTKHKNIISYSITPSIELYKLFLNLLCSSIDFITVCSAHLLSPLKSCQAPGLINNDCMAYN